MQTIRIFLVTLLVILIFQNSGRAQAYAVTLSEPVHFDTLETLRPSFIWNITGLGPRTTFSIKLCKILPSQEAAEAIYSNVPVVQAYELISPSFLFPSQLEDLDSSSHYCWQVMLYDANILVYQSEVREFFTPVKDYYPGPFWNPAVATLGDIFSFPKLAFYYNNKYNLSSLRVKVTGNSFRGQKIYEGPVKLRAGANSIVMNDIPNFPILPAGFYRVLISTKVGEHYSFIYQKPNQ